MRPKFLSLLAVPALALVGCSAAEPAETPSSSPAAVVSESPQPKVEKAEAVTPKKTENPNALIEQQFVDFADTRADVHGATVNRKPKEVAESLYAYCEDGKSINISKSKDLNDNMEYVADKAYCEMLK